jgi:hypothetical protein
MERNGVSWFMFFHRRRHAVVIVVCVVIFVVLVFIGSRHLGNGGGSGGQNSVERNQVMVMNAGGNVDKNGLPSSVSEMLRKRQESRKVQ